MALYREDLEASRCDVPGCEDTTELWFHARCHLGSPTWVTYRDGVVTIVCARCDREIASLVVASRAQARPPPEEDEERCP